MGLREVKMTEEEMDARRMIAKKLPTADIADLTGLTADEIARL